MAQKTESIEAVIALEWGFNEYLINNRYNEIKDAAPYLKYRGASAEKAALFRIAVTRDDLKDLSRIVLDAVGDPHYLTFSINGLFKRNWGGVTELLYNCKPDAATEDRIVRLAAALKESKFADSVVTAESGIPIATADNFGDVESVLSAADGRLSFSDRVRLALLRIPFFAGKRNNPAYKPRKFCGRFDLTELSIFADGKRYKTFDLTAGTQNPQGIDPRHSKKEGYARYRRLRGIDSADVTGTAESADVAETSENPDAGEDSSFAAGKRENTVDDAVTEDAPSSRIMLISDLHLGNAEIICTMARPFAERDIEEMNRVLISNWNRAVKDADRVIFLGDLTYKADRETAENFLKELAGNITFIAGNHDRDISGAVDNHTFEYGGYRFFCVHNPKFAPKDFDGWVIHGHTHNTRMYRYPFINVKERTINVSCELTGFRPVSIDTIIRAIERCRDEKWERADYLEDIF